MKLNNLDLNKLYVFQAVMKHGDFKGAAEELSLTKSALSQSIATLESSLGVELFTRVGRKLVATDRARRFYEEVRKYQLQLQGSVANLVGLEGRAEGVLRVGAYLEFAKSKLMPVLEEFLSHNPECQIRFAFESPSRLDDLLNTAKIDLSISVFPHENSRSVRSRKLYQEELVLVGADRLLGERPSAAHFESVPILDYLPRHQLFKRWWKLHFAGRQFRGRVRSYAATADMVLEMAARGLGVGVVPRYVYESSLAKSTGLQVIQPTDKRLYDHIWLNENAKSEPSVAYRAFMQTLSNRFPSARA